MILTLTGQRNTEFIPDSSDFLDDAVIVELIEEHKPVFSGTPVPGSGVRPESGLVCDADGVSLECCSSGEVWFFSCFRPTELL